MTTSTAPQTNPGTDTPPASYVLRRRYGRARHVILTATWITVINMLVSPVVAMAANLTWDANGATAGQTDGAGTWTAANQWWDGGANQTWNSSTPDNATIGATGAGGTITIGTVTAGTVTFNAFTGTYTLSGGTLTLNGAMTITSSASSLTISTPMGGAGSIAVNSSYAGTLTLSGANTYSGGTTLSAGTIIIGASSSLTVGPLIAAATGPLGKGTLTINGASTLRIDSTTGRTIANDFTLNTSGTVTFGASSTAALTISGQNQSIAGTPTLSFNTVATTFASYPMALNSSATLSNTGAGAPSFNGGLTVASGGSTITDSMSSTLTIVGPLTLNGSLTLTGTHTAGVITMSGITETIVGSGGATLYFNDSAGGNGLTTYTTGPLILGGNFTLTGNSTKKPTVTINGLRVNNGVTSTFTLENNASNITLALGSDWIIGGTLGLTLTTPATAQTIGSRLVGAGGFTLNNGSAGVTLSSGGALFSGTITIGDGVNTTTVLLGGTTGLPILANVSLAAGTTKLDINGYETQIGSLTGGTTATLINTSVGLARTLVVGNANNTTYSGVLTATTPANLLLTKIGSGKLTLNGPVVNTYTGATKVYAGELALDLTNLGSPYQNLISSSSVWTLGGGTVSVKAHASSGAVAVQTLNGTTFAVGASAVSYDNTGASGTSLALAALARSAGSTVKFTLPASGNITTTSSTFVLNNVLVSAAANGIAYATIGTTDWAGLSGNNILTLTGAGGSYAANDFTANTKNTDVTGSQSPAAFTVNTLRFNSDGAALDLNSSGASTVNTGGILITGNANSSGVTISGSGSASLKPGGGKELVVINYGKLALNAVLADNATSAVTYSGTGTTDLTGNSAGNTYVGLTTLNQGTLKVSANNQLGAVGTGAAIHINGGTLQAGATFALDNSGAIPKRGVTVYPAGATFDTGANTLTISGIISSSLANAGLITKTGSGTLVLSGLNTFTGGFNWSAGNLSLGSTAASALGGGGLNVVTFASAGGLLDNTSGSAQTLGDNTMRWNADFAMVGNASASATANDINMGAGVVLLGGNRTITVGQGSNYGTLTVGGVIHDGGMNYSLAKAGAGTLVLSANSTYSGGTTLSAGTLAIGASSTGTLSADPSPGVVYGPVGTGTLTLNGGTLRSTAATSAGDRAIHNALAISGNVTLGDVANNGKLTFMGASQTIAAGSVVTALSPVTFGVGLTIGDGVKFYGPGLVTLQPQTVNNSSSNPIVIGDGTTFSGNGVGGNATVASQNSLGTAAITIHYGGTLTTTVAFNPSNTITVNAGGVAALRGTPSGTIIVNSGGAIGGVGAALALTTGANLTLPTAGYLLNASTTASTISGAYPALTGTMAFGSTSGAGAKLTAGAVGTLSTAAGAARTIAFNGGVAGGTIATILPGITLNADLTVVGSGGYANLFGSSPTSRHADLSANFGATLGAVSGGKNITVNMSPELGLVCIDGNTGVGAANWANTTVNSGALEVRTTSGDNIGTGTATVNGGALRFLVNSSKSIVAGINGGVLESVKHENGAPAAYSGTVTGTAAGSLVLRAGTDRGNTGAGDWSSANFSAFNGDMVLAVGGYVGKPILLGANGLPASGSGQLIVPAGIAFGGAAVTVGNMSRIATTTGSIYWMTSGSVDLSGTGLNRDVWVCYNNNTLTAYTPYGSDYRIVPASLANSTPSAISADGVLSGARNLKVSAQQVVTDSNSSFISNFNDSLGMSDPSLTYRMVVKGQQPYTGTTLITGVITPALQGPAVILASLWLQDGTGTQGDLSGTTGITIDRSASLTLAGTVARYGRITAANVPITVKGGGTLTIGDPATAANNAGVTDRIACNPGGGNDGGDLTLGGDTGGGTLTMAFPGAGNTHAQTLDALTIDQGPSAINTATSGGTANLTFAGGGKYTRNPGGLLTYTAAAGFNPIFATTPTAAAVSAKGLAAGSVRILVGGYAGANDFIKITDSTDTPTAWASMAGSYSVNNALNTWTDENISVTGATSGSVGNTTINSLRTTQGITIGAGNTLTIRSGMVLLAAAVGISGGTGLTGSNGELIIKVGDSFTNAGMTIGTPITQNGGNDLTLTVNSPGNNTWPTLNTANNAIKDIFLHGSGNSSLVSSADRSFGPDNARTIYLYGSNLQFDLSQTYNNTSLVALGGGWIVNGTGLTCTFGGSVKMNGYLRVNNQSRNNAGGGRCILTGSVSGPGVVVVSLTILSTTPATGRLILSGDNVTGANGPWTGGMAIRGGSLVRLDSAKAAGTGPIVWDSDLGILEFGPSFGTSLSNRLVGIAAPSSFMLISNAKTTGNVTLTGNLTTIGGLAFQGVDNGGGAVSETVLANTVAVTGYQGYNFNYAGPAAGNATSVQLFVNAQSGINLGVTAFQGTSLTRLAVGNKCYLAYNAADSAGVTEGAEGYVRFAPDSSGRLNSFLRGAVGPGFVAALRKGGDSADAKAFGYLLTGAKSASGLTGTTTSGSPFVTNMTSTAGFAVGQSISGTGIPANTRIAYIQDGTKLAISANATASGSPSDIAVFGPGSAYQLPEGKSFVIGTLGAGTSVRTGGTFGAGIAGDTDARTVTFTGSPKLAGAPGGDINVHANAAADAAQLNLLARNANDTLTLGVAQTITAASSTASAATITTASAHGLDVGQVVTISGVTPSAYDGTYTITSVPMANTFTYATEANPGAGSGGTAGSSVVVTPTYGDSGATAAITMMAKRTGATTLNKTGAGTVEVKGANFTHTDGTDAHSTITWNVNVGTLYYSQDDAAQAGFAGVSLASGTTLKFKVDGATCTKMNVKDGGTVTLGAGVATLAVEPGAAASQSEYVLVDVGAGATVTGSFANSTVTVGSKSYRVVTNGGDGNDVALKKIPPGSLIMFR